jgi:uncharacterized protein
MDKIPLEIVGLSYSQTQSGAYALVLSESDGNRKLPIIIGGFEAQAIAIELEKMSPNRPLTHDLFKNLTDSFNINVKEVIIYNLVEGVFYAKIILELDGDLKELDARTSDAVALAVRYNVSIFTYEFILSSAGILLNEDENDNLSSSSEVKSEKEESVVAKDSSSSDYDFLSDDELKEKLDQAISQEDYETASRLRDVINKRNQN